MPEELRRINAQAPAGFAPEGFDAVRCVEVRVDGKPFALFAFAASLPFELSVDETDVSPGYAERLAARLVTLRCEGHVPAPDLAGQLQEFVATRLASYKRPRWVEFLPALPKTATGKIQRFKLRLPPSDC